MIQIIVGNCGEKRGIVFLGVNTLNLDAKGRLAIPVKYREELGASDGSGVVVTINPYDRCLWLYPKSDWEEVAQKVMRLPALKKQNKKMQRLLLGHAMELNIDSQGRIRLHPNLRDYAGMDKQVALVGQGRKFEIWNEQKWFESREEWLDDIDQPESEMSEELATLEL